MPKTHYEVLGVPRDATTLRIKTAYREKASTAHPDKGGTPEAMTAINEAYRVLADDRERDKYDLTLDVEGMARTAREVGGRVGKVIETEAEGLAVDAVRACAGGLRRWLRKAAGR